MKIRRALVPLLLAASAALSSCGDDDSSVSGPDDTSSGAASSPTASTAAGAHVVACDLLSSDEVGAAVGTPVKEGIPSYGPAVTGGSFSTCVWQSDDPDAPGGTATVTVYPNADAADSAREDDAQEVEGIGDHAFTGSFASVWTYVADTSVFAQWYSLSGSDEDNLPRSKALAKAVADQL